MPFTPVFLPEPHKRPAGAYSPGIRAGSLLFVSGQVPRNPLTGQIEGNDVPSQTRRVVENIRIVLEAGGATLSDIVSTTCYLADIKDWETFNNTYKELFRPPYPTRTTVGAQLNGVLVEISAVAMVAGK
jgi:2-iminobutanoate/2-iminopropanoate deaminase